MTYKEIETFCEQHRFLFHKNGSGTWGADRYWTFTKVENNGQTLYSIEYHPVRNLLKIRSNNHTYQGVPESCTHVKELLAVMRICLRP